MSKQSSVAGDSTCHCSTDLFTILQAAIKDSPGTQEFLLLLSNLCKHSNDHHVATSLFDWNEEILITRSPGRLDVMGGIADYSGSQVLQLPIAESVHVAVQKQSTSLSHNKPMLRIVSPCMESPSRWTRSPVFEMDLNDLLTQDGRPVSYQEAKVYFRRDPALSWAAYTAGALVVLMHERPDLLPRATLMQHSLAMLISSTVPEGKGVSSSAAVEVAAMMGLMAVFGETFIKDTSTTVQHGMQLAKMCQKVENDIVGMLPVNHEKLCNSLGFIICVVRIVMSGRFSYCTGAACGIMDQVACALGRSGKLLNLLCSSERLLDYVDIPPCMKFWGIDSGIRHSVEGSDYTSVRIGAFMGLKILLQTLHNEFHVDDDTDTHLTKLKPSEYAFRKDLILPVSMKGKDFLEKYGNHLDHVTIVDPDVEYAIRVPTEHPLYENYRVNLFEHVLKSVEPPCSRPLEEKMDNYVHHQLRHLGELMFQSHASYTACQLGSSGTDSIVGLVLNEMKKFEIPGLMGAKITGGGSGGTVCVLGRNDPIGEAAVQRVVQAYAQEGPINPKVFNGTSDGAMWFGVMRVINKEIMIG